MAANVDVHWSNVLLAPTVGRELISVYDKTRSSPPPSPESPAAEATPQHYASSPSEESTQSKRHLGGINIPLPLSKRDTMIRSTKKSLYSVLFTKRRPSALKDGLHPIGFGDASLYHALIVIFLEFFAWGLLTVPIINVLGETFPHNSFLMNGLVMGVKGILSFLSAPLIGSLSDIWGRKGFLAITVFFTCLPIPWLVISPWWYFCLFALSGVFSVTFSVVHAYVADITDKEERSSAYGLVSATFAASLITSPALGAWLSEAWSDQAVVALATCIALADVIIIILFVPESLPPKLRHTWDRVTWQSADPFTALRRVGEDRVVWVLCIVVFLSYLPEAGQFSCFFVYLKLVVGFSPEAVAAFIGLVGILSVFSQTVVLLLLSRTVGVKKTIHFGLVCQFIQLVWYAFGTKYWMLWAAGCFAALSQLTYPSVSAFVSVHAPGDRQGTVQGYITGIRGLCQGLGPAVFGAIFWLADVDLNGDGASHIAVAFPAPQARAQKLAQLRAVVAGQSSNVTTSTAATLHDLTDRFLPGPPFLFGAIMVLLAILCNAYLPINSKTYTRPSRSNSRDDEDGVAVTSTLLRSNSESDEEEEETSRVARISVGD